MTKNAISASPVLLPTYANIEEPSPSSSSLSSADMRDDMQLRERWHTMPAWEKTQTALRAIGVTRMGTGGAQVEAWVNGTIELWQDFAYDRSVTPLAPDQAFMRFDPEKRADLASAYLLLRAFIQDERSAQPAINFDRMFVISHALAEQTAETLIGQVNPREIYTNHPFKDGAWYAPEVDPHWRPAPDCFDNGHEETRWRQMPGATKALVATCQVLELWAGQNALESDVQRLTDMSAKEVRRVFEPLTQCAQDWPTMRHELFRQMASCDSDTWRCLNVLDTVGRLVNAMSEASYAQVSACADAIVSMDRSWWSAETFNEVNVPEVWTTLALEEQALAVAYAVRHSTMELSLDAEALEAQIADRINEAFLTLVLWKCGQDQGVTVEQADFEALPPQLQDDLKLLCGSMARLEKDWEASQKNGEDAGENTRARLREDYAKTLWITREADKEKAFDTIRPWAMDLSGEVFDDIASSMNAMVINWTNARWDECRGAIADTSLCGHFVDVLGGHTPFDWRKREDWTQLAYGAGRLLAGVIKAPATFTSEMYGVLKETYPEDGLRGFWRWGRGDGGPQPEAQAGSSRLQDVPTLKLPGTRLGEWLDFLIVQGGGSFGGMWNALSGAGRPARLPSYDEMQKMLNGECDQPRQSSRPVPPLFRAETICPDTDLVSQQTSAAGTGERGPGRESPQDVFNHEFAAPAVPANATTVAGQTTDTGAGDGGLNLAPGAAPAHIIDTPVANATIYRDPPGIIGAGASQFNQTRVGAADREFPLPGGSIEPDPVHLSMSNAALRPPLSDGGLLGAGGDAGYRMAAAAYGKVAATVSWLADGVRSGIWGDGPTDETVGDTANNATAKATADAPPSQTQLRGKRDTGEVADQPHDPPELIQDAEGRYNDPQAVVQNSYLDNRLVVAMEMTDDGKFRLIGPEPNAWGQATSRMQVIAALEFHYAAQRENMWAGTQIAGSIMYKWEKIKEVMSASAMAPEAINEMLHDMHSYEQDRLKTLVEFADIVQRGGNWANITQASAEMRARHDGVHQQVTLTDLLKTRELLDYGNAMPHERQPALPPQNRGFADSAAVTDNGATTGSNTAGKSNGWPTTRGIADTTTPAPVNIALGEPWRNSEHKFNEVMNVVVRNSYGNDTTLVEAAWQRIAERVDSFEAMYVHHSSAQTGNQTEVIDKGLYRLKIGQYSEELRIVATGALVKDYIDRHPDATVAEILREVPTLYEQSTEVDLAKLDRLYALRNYVDGFDVAGARELKLDEQPYAFLQGVVEGNYKTIPPALLEKIYSGSATPSAFGDDLPLAYEAAYQWAATRHGGAFMEYLASAASSVNVLSDFLAEIHRHRRVLIKEEMFRMPVETNGAAQQNTGIVFKDWHFSNAVGKTLADMVDDPSFNNIPGVRSLPREEKIRLLGEKFDEIGEDKQYPVGSPFHTLATWVKQTRIIQGKPLPETHVYGSEADLFAQINDLKAECATDDACPNFEAFVSVHFAASRNMKETRYLDWATPETAEIAGRFLLRVEEFKRIEGAWNRTIASGHEILPEMRAELLSDVHSLLDMIKKIDFPEIRQPNDLSSYFNECLDAYRPHQFNVSAAIDELCKQYGFTEQTCNQTRRYEMRVDGVRRKFFGTPKEEMLNTLQAWRDSGGTYEHTIHKAGGGAFNYGRVIQDFTKLLNDFNGELRSHPSTTAAAREALFLQGKPETPDHLQTEINRIVAERRVTINDLFNKNPQKIVFETSITLADIGNAVIELSPVGSVLTLKEGIEKRDAAKILEGIISIGADLWGATLAKLFVKTTKAGYKGTRLVNAGSYVQALQRVKPGRPQGLYDFADIFKGNRAEIPRGLWNQVVTTYFPSRSDIGSVLNEVLVNAALGRDQRFVNLRLVTSAPSDTTGTMPPATDPTISAPVGTTPDEIDLAREANAKSLYDSAKQMAENIINLRDRITSERAS